MRSILAHTLTPAFLVLTLALQAEASIVSTALFIDPSRPLTLEEVDEVVQSIAVTTTGAAGRPAQRDEAQHKSPAPADDPILPQLALLPTDAGSTGNTSSSSSLAGGGGASMSAITMATVTVDNDLSISRLTLGQSLFLPALPGVDLLRPPQ